MGCGVAKRQHPGGDPSFAANGQADASPAEYSWQQRVLQQSTGAADARSLAWSRGTSRLASSLVARSRGEAACQACLECSLILPALWLSLAHCALLENARHTAEFFVVTLS